MSACSIDSQLACTARRSCGPWHCMTFEPMSHVIDVYIVGQQGWWEVSGECHPRKLYPGSESVLPGALVWPAQVKTGESSVAGQRPGSQDCVMRLTA